MHFFTFLLLVCCLGTSIRAAHWNYQNPFWGGICDTGYKQSPINLDYWQSERVSVDRPNLRSYYRAQTNLKMVNNGHTIMVDGFNPMVTIRAGGQTKKGFVLEQFHMHWGSEHTLDGSRYPLELHFVHRNTMYPDVQTALNHEDGILVIGVLFHMSYRDNYDLQSIVRHLRAVKHHSNINKPVRISGSLILDNLLPSLSSYYAYNGSLTTPRCAEVVTWIVPTRTLPVSYRQVEQFKQIEYMEGMQLRHNYRELQRRRNRIVYLVSTTSGQERLSVSISLILIFVLVNQKFLL